MEFRSWFVRSFVRSFVGVRPFFLYCTTVLYSSVVHVRMCSKQNTRRTTGTRRDTHHGHYTGNSSTGTSRPRTEVLRTCTYFSAANTLLRSRASRGHLNLYVCKYVSSFDRYFADFSFLIYTSRNIFLSIAAYNGANL